MNIIYVIGAGGIGSFLVEQLVQAGIQNICVIDDDVVEQHNIENQIYRPTDIGRNKCDALADIIKIKYGVEIKTCLRRYRGEKLNGVVVSAVDSMESRATIWGACKHSSDVEMLCDVRLGGSIGKVLSIAPKKVEDQEFYEADLFPDETALGVEKCVSFGMTEAMQMAKLVVDKVIAWCREGLYCKFSVYDLCSARSFAF